MVPKSQKQNKLEIVEYNIEKHSGEVQKILDEHLIPIYLKRMEITQDERLKYAHIENVLHPNLAKNPKFENFSMVTLDEAGKVVGLGLSYMVTKQDFQETFIDLNLRVVNDSSYKESIRKYCQHRYAVCYPLARFFDEYNIDQMVYTEDAVVLPQYRGRGINNNMYELMMAEFGHKHAFFAEEMMPVQNIVTSGGLKHELDVIGTWDSDGWLCIDRQLSYDGYLCPLFFKPLTHVHKSKL
eukprot:TCONS_00043757-protein